MNNFRKMILKLIKFILKAIGALLIIFIIFNLGYMYYLTDRKDAYLIKETVFQYKDFQKLRERFEDCQANCSEPAFQVQLHRLVPGAGFIFAIREYNEGTIAIDDEGFKKLTIWMPSLQLGEHKFGTDGIKGYFTAGGAAWPENSCGGEIKEGVLNIIKIESNRTEIEIIAKFICSRKNGKSEKEISLNNKYELSDLNYNEVSPWIGKESEHIYEETYRR